MAVVGIDLGTTNTVIAAVRDGRAAALKDKHGNALLPSVVSFTPKGTPKVGTAGKARRTIDPENTVFSIKRLIGRPYDSEPVQKAKTRFPFTLKGGPGKSTLVNCYGMDHSLPEISALVLAEAQAIAEARLGEPVADAVITVPANFNDLQRAATKVAGRTAGLEVLRIINEPTAAALAYGFGKTGRERIAVYDFGGGTFDVTLLDLRDNVFEVLSTAGDTFLGGDDLDRAILDRMAEELLRKQKVDASFDNLVREQLRVAAERLKIELSTRSMTKVRVEELDFEFTMRRSEFETMAEPFVAQTLAVCQEALELADVSKKDLDQILLVGGSTRIPLVRRRISSFFGKMPQSRINPDEVVAIGAAIQASALETKQNKASVMPAPLPRHSAEARNPGGGSTQLGLAGLRKTLAGTGRISDLPQQQQSVSSVLSALQSARPPAGRSHHLPTSPPVAAPRVRTGMGARGSSDDQPKRTTTLSGLASPAQAPETPPTPTNLGLGSLAPPPSSSSKPLHHRGASAPKADIAPMFPQGGARAPSDSPSSGDGSVTFDLEELEIAPPPDEFDSLEDETTQVVEPARADAEAAKLDSIADAEDSAVGQLRPRNQAEPVELGDSALFTLEEDDDQEHSADLPMPAAGLPARIAPAELGDSALFSLEPDDEDEAGDLQDLPVRSTRPPAFDTTTQLGTPGVGLPIARRHAHAGLPGLPDLTPGLPSRRQEHPGAGSGLTPQGHRPLEEDVRDLPLVGAGLPERPLPGLPERLDAPAHPYLGTSVGSPLGFSAPLDRSRFGTPGAGAVLPAPSVNELDELSVSAPLPTDDEPDPQFDLQPGARRGSAPGLQPPASDSPTRAAVGLGQAPPREHTWEDAQVATLHEPMAHAPQPAAPLLLDVTPLSLGVEVVGGYVDRLIERNSPVPCERTRTFATVQDNQQLVRVRVSQGEDGRFEANTVLGEVELVGLPAGPRGTVKVDVSFSLDESGMLQVSARDPATGNAAQARLMLTGVAP